MRTPKRNKNCSADDQEWIAEQNKLIEAARNRLGREPPPPQPPPPPDEDLAMEYIGGTVDRTGKQLSCKYLEPGSEREREAKKALARLLRGDDPISKMIRWRLAALIDPHKAEARQFKISNRKRGEQPNHLLDVEIAIFVAGKVTTGIGVDAAVEEAWRHYGGSLRSAYRAWDKHKMNWLPKPDANNIN
jgi:hypothetical protein